MTLTKAFAQFGARLGNVRWQCSALAEDGALVFSCWSSHLTSERGGRTYQYTWAEWGTGNPQGRKLLQSHLQLALEEHRPVRLVIATLHRPEDRTRITTDASPFSKKRSPWTRTVVGGVQEVDDHGFVMCSALSRVRRNDNEDSPLPD